MNVYDIEIDCIKVRTHSVVANSTKEAKALFLVKYPTSKIVAVYLHSEYVQIQGVNDE